MLCGGERDVEGRRAVEGDGLEEGVLSVLGDVLGGDADADGCGGVEGCRIGIGVLEVGGTCGVVDGDGGLDYGGGAINNRLDLALLLGGGAGNGARGRIEIGLREADVAEYRGGVGADVADGQGGELERDGECSAGDVDERCCEGGVRDAVEEDVCAVRGVGGDEGGLGRIEDDGGPAVVIEWGWEDDLDIGEVVRDKGDVDVCAWIEHRLGRGGADGAVCLGDIGIICDDLTGGVDGGVVDAV